jgi:hypothetical protein
VVRQIEMQHTPLFEHWFWQLRKSFTRGRILAPREDVWAVVGSGEDLACDGGAAAIGDVDVHAEGGGDSRTVVRGNCWGRALGNLKRQRVADARATPERPHQGVRYRVRADVRTMWRRLQRLPRHCSFRTNSTTGISASSKNVAMTRDSVRTERRKTSTGPSNALSATSSPPVHCSRTSCCALSQAPGPGKSRLVQDIGMHVFKAGFSVVCRSIFELDRELQSERSPAELDLILERHRKVDQLIIGEMDLTSLTAKWLRRNYHFGPGSVGEDKKLPAPCGKKPGAASLR